MPHFAFYHVLADNNVLTLPNFNPGDEEDINTHRLVLEDPAGDIDLDVPAEFRPLLCYNVDADNADQFRLRVLVRDLQGADREISDSRWNGQFTHQVMEPFPGKWLRKDRSKFFFKRESGAGGVQIRNVILFYIRDTNL